MKVKELIAKLGELPEDAEVILEVVSSYGAHGWVVQEVEGQTYEDGTSQVFIR